jgi:hypothetical protein
MSCPYSSRAAGPARRIGLALLLAGALLASGCDTIKSMMPAARKAEQTQIELLETQERNMRFADEYVGELLETNGPGQTKAEDPADRLVLAGWMLGQANAAYTTASGDNPIVATLDLLTLAVLSRMVAENSLNLKDPSFAASLVEAQRNLEAQAWLLAGNVLTLEQQRTVGNLFDEWRKQNPGFQNVFYVRFQDFVSLVGKTGTVASHGSSGSGGIFGFLGLDPLSGLDPAVQEVERSRLLAARAMYYGQRLPTLMDLQMSRSLALIEASPGLKRLDERSASLTDSADRFVGVAEALPDSIAREREALIRQLSEALTSQAATLRPMLVEMRGTLEAGSDAAKQLDAATRSLDALVARFERKPGEPPGRPFDVTEYGQAAAEIGRAAGELRVLLDATGSETPKLGAALGAGVAQGRELVDYFFARVAWLIALLCFGLLATLLLYRRLAPRERPTG